MCHLQIRRVASATELLALAAHMRTQAWDHNSAAALQAAFNYLRKLCASSASQAPMVPAARAPHLKGGLAVREHRSEHLHIHLCLRNSSGLTRTSNSQLERARASAHRLWAAHFHVQAHAIVAARHQLLDRGYAALPHTGASATDTRADVPIVQFHTC